MLSFNESLKILKETNALLEGHFILSSGLHSAEYVQCARLLSFPKQAEKILSEFNKLEQVQSEGKKSKSLGKDKVKSKKISKK